MSLPSLLQLIPPQAVYRRRQLDPRLNALGPWQDAVEKFVLPDDEDDNWKKLVYSTQMLAMRISPAQATSAREILRQNAACLDALEQGLERRQLQFDEFRSLEQVSAERIS